MVATTVGFLDIVLAIWLWRSMKRRWMSARTGGAGRRRRPGSAGWPDGHLSAARPISIAHACLAQLFFSTTVAIALFTSPAWKRGAQTVEDAGTPSLRSLPSWRR